jgi:formylmethanofuran dehydrogenase subunit A
MELTTLPSITREYTLEEIATMTRAAPAKLLGLADRGHLGPDAVADIAVYADQPDRARMFRAASLVFKNGDLVAREGEIALHRWGRALIVSPGHDRAVDRRMKDYYDRRYGLSPDVFTVPEQVLGRVEPFERVPCVS